MLGYPITSVSPPFLRFWSVDAHTAVYQLTSGDSMRMHTNLAASGTVTLTANQSASEGEAYLLYVAADYALRFDPGAAGACKVLGGKQPDNKYIYASDIGDYVWAVADGNGDWNCLIGYGAWGVEQ